MAGGETRAEDALGAILLHGRVAGRAGSRPRETREGWLTKSVVSPSTSRAGRARSSGAAGTQAPRAESSQGRVDRMPAGAGVGAGERAAARPHRSRRRCRRGRAAQGLRGLQLDARPSRAGWTTRGDQRPVLAVDRQATERKLSVYRNVTVAGGRSAADRPGVPRWHCRGRRCWWAYTDPDRGGVGTSPSGSAEAIVRRVIDVRSLLDSRVEAGTKIRAPDAALCPKVASSRVVPDQ